MSQNKLLPADIESKIVSESYTVLPSGKVMICELTLENGYSVIGKAGVVDKANFSEERGREVSRQNAVNAVWELEGYLLQEKLHREK